MKFVLLIAMISVSQNISAQTNPVKKIYAYRQSILSGKKPSQYEKAKATERFYIYAEVSKKQKSIINGIWINNTYYSFRVKQQLKQPVKKVMMEGMEEFTFVPKTSNDVYEMIIDKKKEPSPRPGRELGLLLQQNEVVISYTCKGKQHYASAEKMIVLESMPMQ
jgi:hypothetical protein